MDAAHQAWLLTAIADDQNILQHEIERLDGIRAGRRFKPRNIRLGWSDPVEAQTAYLEAIRQWIEHLRAPDKWLIRFFERPDFDSAVWRMKYDSRRTEDIRTRAWEPVAERQRALREEALEGRAPPSVGAGAAHGSDRQDGDLRAGRRLVRDLRAARAPGCLPPRPRRPAQLRRGSCPENLRVTHRPCNEDRGNGPSTGRL
jgi:hypothetical protein